jgi:hypothetical protein
MGGASIARSVGVVLVALLLIGFIDQTLERTVVNAIGQGAVKDEASYVAVRNRPVVLALTVITHGLASLLTGYVLGKLAGANEVQHAIAAAVLATIAYAFAFVTPNVMLPPVWVRIVVLLITPPALVAGAYVRGQARLIRLENDSNDSREPT